MWSIRDLQRAVVLPLMAGAMLLLISQAAAAQEASPDITQYDQNQLPLGDVARNLRKNNSRPQQVIDDDNLPQVMAQAENNKPSSGLRYVMDREDKSFHVSAPDVTCSLAFTANVRSLLSSQYAQMELPPADLLKLQGPATIEGDALTVTVFNGSAWHLSEIAVAVTVVRKVAPDATGSASGLVAQSSNAAELAVRPEKNPDTTFIFRMRAAGAPWARTVFSAPLNGDLAPGEEWHWAIVQARGYPPQTNVADLQTSPADSSNERVVAQPATTPLPLSSPAASSQNEQ